MNYSSLQSGQSDWSQPAARILLSGRAFTADVSGALLWPAEQTLIVSDPLLKSSEGPSNPFALQTHETGSTLIRLSEIAGFHDAKRIIILGCHEEGGADQIIDDESMQRLEELQRYHLCYWAISGEAPDYLRKLNATISDHYVFKGITFRHKPTRAPVAHEISGYVQPVARLSGKQDVKAQRCFISSNNRLIMPAFSSGGQGHNILGKEFDPMFAGQNRYVWLISPGNVSLVASRLLCED